MARPKWSLKQNFSLLGRLKNACASALSDEDASRALARLRRLYPRFEFLGEVSAPLWPSFLESVLDVRFFPYLREADFDGLGALGDRLAAAGVVAPAQSRWLIAEASVARGTAVDLQRAHRLLSELYEAQWIQDDIRLGAAARLAGLGVVGDPQLAIYAGVLTRRLDLPTEVADLVAAILNVGFDSDAERLRLAWSLAMRLGDPAARADAAFALGLGELLLHQRPQSAAPLFATALSHAGSHTEALRGLLSAHLQSREIPLAIAAAQKAAVLSPRCADLLMLCEVLAWLEEAPGTYAVPSQPSAAPPATIARLSAIAPGRDTGPWRDYVLGRVYLLDGDARQAQQSLTRVLDAGVSDADVHYHAAWAHLLCRNPEGVRASYDALADAAGSWALGCLLQDAPGLEPPASAPAVPDGFEQVAAARQALVTQGALPEALDMQNLIASGALQANLFEALRTALAVAAAHGRVSPEILEHPLFARLPAAERLIWTALALRTSDPEQSRLVLRRAIELGRDRAAVLLALDAVRDGRPGEVRELLSDVPGPKAALLLAWADAHAGADEDAATRFSELAALGLAQADYALALLALRDAADAWARGDFTGAHTHAQRAVVQLKTVRTSGEGHFEVSLLELAAESMASAADPAELNWQGVAAEPWTARLLGVARLAGAPESVDVDLFRHFPDWLRPETHGTALAQAAFRVMLLAKDDAARQEATVTLARLGERSSGANLSQSVRCFAARTGRRMGDGLDDTPNDPLAALVNAGLVPGGADRAEVIRRLHAARLEDGRAAHAALVTVLATALEGKELPNPLPFDAPAAVAAALAAASASGQVAAGNPAVATDTLLKAFLAYKMDGLVDFRRVLPHVVVRAARRGRRDAVIAVFAPAMRQAVAEANEPGADGDLTAACYSTLLGDFETAQQAWRRALKQGASDDGWLNEIWGEYVRFLCHQAAVAHADGDQPTVLDCMRTAALYLPEKVGRIYVELDSWHMVRTLVSTLFPDSPIVCRLRQGRHPRLSELIRANPDLKRALKSGTREHILQQWRLAAVRAGHDIELWHTLAILAREDAFARPIGPRSTDQARITATALWLMLLTDPALHAHFAGLTLPGEADEAFREEITEALLADQKARLTQAVAQDDRETAEQGLRCLEAVGQGLTATERLLERCPFFTVAAGLAGDEDDFVPIAERARKLIEATGADLVMVANRTLTDGEAIRRLGEDSKLDKNYESALGRLKLALLLERPPNNVLCAALDWGYDWFLCLHNQGDDEAASAVLDVMRPFSKHLIPRCTPGRGHAAENKALSWFSLACGMSAARSARKVGGARRVELFEVSCAHEEQACAWDPEWEPPKRELCRSRGEKLFALGDFIEAETVLRDLKDDNQAIGVLYNNHALDCRRDARALLRIAETPEHVDAATDLADEYVRMLLEKAARLLPGDPVIRGNVRAIDNIHHEIARKRQKLDDAAESPAQSFPRTRALRGRNKRTDRRASRGTRTDLP